MCCQKSCHRARLGRWLFLRAESARGQKNRWPLLQRLGVHLQYDVSCASFFPSCLYIYAYTGTPVITALFPSPDGTGISGVLCIQTLNITVEIYVVYMFLFFPPCHLGSGLRRHLVM